MGLSLNKFHTFFFGMSQNKNHTSISSELFFSLPDALYINPFYLSTKPPLAFFFSILNQILFHI